MRKDRYLEQFAIHLPYLRAVAGKTGLDYDEAYEVVSRCAIKMLTDKTYVSKAATNLKAFLRQHVRFAALDFIKSRSAQKRKEARLPDPEQPDFDNTLLLSTTVQIDETETLECPFCFKANLNEYGACTMCHTIVPSHMRRQNNVIVMSAESLAVVFDFNTKLDVQKAIARLTPFEQRVVTAIGLENETLDSFADFSSDQRQAVWRTWARAKAKLQQSLHEYAPQKIARRGPTAFKRALQGI